MFVYKCSRLHELMFDTLTLANLVHKIHGKSEAFNPLPTCSDELLLFSRLNYVWPIITIANWEQASN